MHAVPSAREPTQAWLMDMDGVLVHEEQAIPRSRNRSMNRSANAGSRSWS